MTRNILTKWRALYQGVSFHDRRSLPCLYSVNFITVQALTDSDSQQLQMYIQGSCKNNTLKQQERTPYVQTIQ